MNTRLNNDKHISLNEAILQVQTESILRKVANAVRNTTQRVKNARDWGFKTDAQVAAKKAEQRARWAREDAARPKSTPSTSPRKAEDDAPKGTRAQREAEWRKNRDLERRQQDGLYNRKIRDQL